MRKLIILLVVLVVIVSGISLYFVFKGNNNTPNNTNEDIYKYEATNIYVENEILSSEHCLNDLCFNNLTIYYEKDNVSSISADVVNKGTSPLNSCVNIHFIISETETEDIKTCFNNLEPNNEIPIEQQFTDSKKHLINATNYELIEVEN